MYRSTFTSRQFHAIMFTTIILLGCEYMQLLRDYIISLTHLYGIVHKEKVIEIYNEQNREPISIAHIDRVMREDTEQLAKGFAFIEGNYFIFETIMIFDDIADVLRERMGKPFYVPRKNELLKYKDTSYFEQNKYYRALYRFVLKNLTDGNKERATDICEDIQVTCQDDFLPSDVFEVFNRLKVTFENEAQVRETLDLVMELSNHTRLWANNGYTPTELFNMEQRAAARDARTKSEDERPTKQQRVGRNAPCPCGSGKKYKRCCLV